LLKVRGTTAISLEDPEAGSAATGNAQPDSPLVNSPLVIGAQPALKPTAPMATIRPSLKNLAGGAQGVSSLYT
jgi:hypothetical protein